MVASLAINPNTVLKAYKELETKGLTAGRPGQRHVHPRPGAGGQVALPELAALRKSLLRLAGRRRRGGLEQDGMGRGAVLPARCGISMSAAAGSRTRGGAAGGETEGVA